VPILSFPFYKTLLLLCNLCLCPMLSEMQGPEIFWTRVFWDHPPVTFGAHEYPRSVSLWVPVGAIKSWCPSRSWLWSPALRGKKGGSGVYRLFFLFFFFFWWDLGLNFRASHFAKHVLTAWAMPLFLFFFFFCCGYFGNGVLQTVFLDWPQTINLQISASQVPRIISMSYQHLA
jgi:hypothetical protein